MNFLRAILSPLSVSALAATPWSPAIALTRTQAPCVAPGGGTYCVTFNFNTAAGLVRSFTFTAPGKGTATVSFHGSMTCISGSVSLDSQIVTVQGILADHKGPGGLRHDATLGAGQEAAFNLASTRVFTINGAGSQTYYFKIRKSGMNPGAECFVYNAAFTVQFDPEP